MITEHRGRALPGTLSSSPVPHARNAWLSLPHEQHAAGVTHCTPGLRNLPSLFILSSNQEGRGQITRFLSSTPAHSALRWDSAARESSSAITKQQDMLLSPLPQTRHNLHSVTKKKPGPLTHRDSWGPILTCAPSFWQADLFWDRLQALASLSLGCDGPWHSLVWAEQQLTSRFDGACLSGLCPQK